MPCQSTIRALDHAVLVCGDLDGAKENWSRLGFTVSPRMKHEALGSSNRVIVFADTYLELLGDLDRMIMPYGLHYRARLAKGDGLAEPAFKSSDLARDSEAFAAARIDHQPIGSARRMVALPDGSLIESSSDFLAPVAPEGTTVSPFLVHHHRPEAIYIRAFADHANGAKAVAGLTFLSRDPERDAMLLGEVVRSTPKLTHGGITVCAANAEVELLTPDGARSRYGEFAAHGPDRGVGITIAVDSLDRCASAVVGHPEPIRAPTALLVPPEPAGGVFIRFVQSEGNGHAS